MIQKKHITHKIIYLFNVWLTGILFLIVPSVNVENLMNGTQSGKTFVFLHVVYGIGTLVFIRFIYLKKYLDIRISFLDVLLFTWILYTLLNGYFQGIPFSLRFLDLTGLVILYIVLRLINRKYYVFLFLAVMLGGLIQAVYGNLQLWGYYPSHHGLFKMTGSFFNPGPYAGYLAGVFPVALGYYLFNINIFNPEQTEKLNLQIERIKNLISRFVKKGIRYFLKHTNSQKEPLAEKQQEESGSSNYTNMLVFSTIVAIVLVIPASRSRASWLAIIISTCFLLIIRYKVFLRDLFKRFLNTFFKKAAFGFVFFLLAGVCIWGLYHFKKGSADGRLLIWKIATEIIKDYPLTGVGFDRFKAHYMNYQAEYFRLDPYSEEAMVAGDTNYAFNEILQFTSENGIIGLLLILLILLVTFYNKPKSSTDDAEKDNVNNFLTLTAKAGIISILIFSLFAYPLQILPIKMCFVLFLAFIAGTKAPIIITKKEVLIKEEKTFVPSFIRIVLVACLLFGAGWGTKQLIIYTNSYICWKNAYRFYQVGAYRAILKDFNEAYPVLKNNGDFLTNHGKALSMAEKHSEAEKILQQAAVTYPNIVVFTALGDSYKNLKEPEHAEKAYFHAWYMNPSKFYPKYLLAKLYDESGQTEKASVTAMELMDKEIKVESTAIQEIRDEMKNIIEKGKR